MEQSEQLQATGDVYANIIYVAGGSFVAGSAVTLFILLMLDFARRNVEKRDGGERKKGERIN